MNKLKLIVWFLAIILINISCKSLKNESSQKKHVNLNKEIVYQSVLLGKVISIDSSYNVFEIIIKDSLDRKYKVLTEKVDYRSYNGKDIVIGQNYKFRVIQLTFSKMANNFRKMVINDKEIKISPSHYIKDCIVFDNHEFCNDTWEVYEALNLVNLRINGI